MWDCSLIVEDHKTLMAVRISSAKGIDAAKKRRLKSSLPEKAYNAMIQNDGTCIVTYKHAGEKWSIEAWDTTSSDIAEVTRAELGKHGEYTLAAWNMRSHDKHVLDKELGTDFMKNIDTVDPLVAFRKRICLPKNNLGSAAAGTPRHVFCVNHTDMGPVHTSLVDALNMLLVCLRAFHCLAEAQDDKAQLAVILSCPEKCMRTGVPVHEMLTATFEALEDVVVRGSEGESWEKVSKDPPSSAVDELGWLRSADFWQPRTLKPSKSIQYKRNVTELARKYAKDNKVTPYMQARINRMRTEDDVADLLRTLLDSAT